MTTWNPDICDCQLTLGKDGEPQAFAVSDATGLEIRCQYHQKTAPADVASECRAKENSREAVRAALGLQQPPDWQRGEDGGHEIILPNGLDKATMDKVTAAVALVADPALTKLTTLGEIAAASVATPSVATDLKSD